ncbi:transcriptional regulator BetI [Dongia sp.]|uniref:transcriptional regulator BetI n=1 Tax=Dongia sp. TaxID=1977262 RepID=UPI0035AF5487
MSRELAKEARRRQLIEATIDGIARKGFTDLKIADVAAEAGLSVGIVNFYFKSKDALLIATLKHLVEDYEQHVAQTLARAGKSAATQIDAMIEADFARNHANRKYVTVWYAFWGETRWRPEFSKLCADLSTSFQQSMTRSIERLIEEGGYQGIDAGLVARGFNAMIDGLWLDMLINPKQTDRDTAKASVRTYLAALFPKEFGQQRQQHPGQSEPSAA